MIVKGKTEWLMQDAFQQMLEDNYLKDKYIEHKIYTIWGEVVGPVILKYTSKLVLKNKKLYINISSPIVKNELRMLRSEIIEKIQQKIGTNYIIDVIIK